ncbi:MAG: hypothetical protein RIQ89_842 [Bacteroidota bacterium]
MEVITTAYGLSKALAPHQKLGASVGFVPTMGALHHGHYSLVAKACSENEVVVVSIFVNPTQFNNAEDLEKYPRTLTADAALLADLPVNYIYCPMVPELYPEWPTVAHLPFDFEGLDQVMEGAHRAGHFQGVVTVVSRLFDQVQPTHAYFGEKDFQQLAIIRSMVHKMRMPVQIVACPTLRETDGLAMSSRNVRLTSAGRTLAASIYSSMRFCKVQIESQQSMLEAINQSKQYLAAQQLTISYFTVVDDRTLKEATTYQPHLRIFAACIIDGVRLIDNMAIV